MRVGPCGYKALSNLAKWMRYSWARIMLSIALFWAVMLADGNVFAQEDRCKSIAFSPHPQGAPLKNSTGQVFKGGDPFVLYDQEKQIYRLWHTWWDSIHKRLGIAYAESKDGIIWMQYESQKGHPELVLAPTEGTWDARGIETNAVVKKDGQYHLWYMGYPGANPDGSLYTGFGRRKAIGYAVSDDGIHWKKGKSR
jgi:hypothetical protein